MENGQAKRDVEEIIQTKRRKGNDESVNGEEFASTRHIFGLIFYFGSSGAGSGSLGGRGIWPDCW